MLRRVPRNVNGDSAILLPGIVIGVILTGVKLPERITVENVLKSMM